MFHRSNLGSNKLPSDLNGMVPESGDQPEDFFWGHRDFLDDFDELGNGYVGCAQDQWWEFRNLAILKTREFIEDLAD